MSRFRKDIETAINRNSMENGSDTPDFILAQYLLDCLAAFDKATSLRADWYGKPIVGNGPPEPVFTESEVRAILRDMRAAVDDGPFIPNYDRIDEMIKFHGFSSDPT